MNNDVKGYFGEYKAVCDVFLYSNQDIKIIQGSNEIILSFDELEEIMDNANREYNYKPEVIDYLRKKYDYNAMVETDSQLLNDFLDEYISLRKENDGGDDYSCLSWAECLNEVKEYLKYRLEKYSFELPQYKAVDITWDVDYTDKGTCPKEILIPRAFANNECFNENDIEGYIDEYIKYVMQTDVGYNSYSLVPTQLIAENIKWDIDDEENPLFLPTTIEIPDDFKGNEDEISDYISEKYGFCHKGYDLKAI